ncbi:MAG: hypothetical protein ACRD4M_05945 [Candidatus Acidiferrales bacterium]
MKVVGAFLVVALFVGAGIHAERVAATQQRLAESWNSDAAYYSASGLFGDTLRNALPERTQVQCDAMVDSIKSDKKMVVELRRSNFRSVECGRLRGDLK